MFDRGIGIAHKEGEETLNKETPMSRLIAAYRKLPSPSNRAKLASYLAKHQMATCLASAEERAFLLANEFAL